MARRASGLSQAATILPLAIGLAHMALHNPPAGPTPETPEAESALVAKKKPVVCGTHCGTERWDVKTLTDPDFNKVRFTPKSVQVSDLTDLAAPDPDPSVSRLSSAEKQTWSVKAKLIGYKKEGGAKGDQDFHIVIADPTDLTNTMIVEIPSADCTGVCSSPKLAQMQAARKQFEDAFPSAPPGSKFEVLQDDVDVQLTGVGLFDFFHGQTGVAKNCIELHPVLSFKFITPGPYKTIPDGPGKPPKADAADHSCISP